MQLCARLLAAALARPLTLVLLPDNRINGDYSCGNNETLATDYKARAGFEGWVMSDWGATHSMSIDKGLDQEMPGGQYMGNKLLAAAKSGAVKMATIDDSVMRILTQMYKFGLFDNMAQWNGTAHNADVTSIEKSQLARELAAKVRQPSALGFLRKSSFTNRPLIHFAQEARAPLKRNVCGCAQSTVLLKNNGILPLKPSASHKIVLIGDDATKPTVHGGGSGSVQPMYTISPFSAISTRNGGTVPKSGPPGGGGGGGAPVNCTVMDEDTDYFAVGGGSSGMAHPQQKSVEGWCAANVGLVCDCLPRL